MATTMTTAIPHDFPFLLRDDDDYFDDYYIFDDCVWCVENGVFVPSMMRRK